MEIVAYYEPQLDALFTKSVREVLGSAALNKVEKKLFVFTLSNLTFPLPTGTLIKFADIAQGVEGIEEEDIDGDVWFKVLEVEYRPSQYPDTVFLRLAIESYFDIGIENLIKCLRAKSEQREIRTS